MRVAAVLAVAGCSSTPAASPAEIAAFSGFSNLIPVHATIGGTTGWVYVDTGDPSTHLDGSYFTVLGATLQTGKDVPVKIGARPFGTIEAFNEPLIDLHLDPSLPIEGVLGCSLTCSHTTALDYRDAALDLDPTASPPDLGADIAVDFDLEGGHDPQSGVTTASRVVVTAMIEGNPHRLVVDSGAQHVAVTAPVFNTLISDHRAVTTLTDISSAVYGQTPYRETRAAAVVVGGVEVDNVVVAQADAFDAKIAQVSTDAGETIDGSLGGTFLHDFYVTIDYPNHKVHFARYADLGFAIDPAHAIGIQIGLDDSHRFAVTAVSAAAAAQGVAVGELVTAIDGHALDADTAFQAFARVYGEVGQTKQVTINGHTIALTVEDWLPLP